MIRLLIIDDEPAAASLLQLLIERHIDHKKEIKLCSSPTEALQLIPVFQPNLILLDVEMPFMDGFDLLNRLPSRDFDVIFTTAYNQYAIKAIRFSALDYLLKPIDVTDLQHAFNRYLMRTGLVPFEQNKLVDNLISNLRQQDASFFKLALSTTEGVQFYSPEDIIRCEGNDNYTYFHFAGRKPLIVARTLKEFEEILTDHGFIRVHKSHLVNIRQITRLDKEGAIWLKDESQVPVSRRRRNEVMVAIRSFFRE